MTRSAIAILTHGNHLADFRRCLTSVLEHTPADAFDLRLGFDQATESFHYALGRLCSDRSALVYDRLPGEVERFSWSEPSGMTVHCWHSPTDFAKRAMTHLLYDVPVRSEYVVWFDDNASAEAGWWEAMAAIMDRKIDYSGRQSWFDLTPGQEAEIKAQAWYTGVPFVKRNNRPGSLFMSGFLAVRNERLRQVHLGDAGDVWKGDRFKRYGSAILLGEAARQLGWTQAKHSEHVNIRSEPEDSPTVSVRPRVAAEKANGEVSRE